MSQARQPGHSSFDVFIDAANSSNLLVGMLGGFVGCCIDPEDAPETRGFDSAKRSARGRIVAITLTGFAPQICDRTQSYRSLQVLPR